MASDATTAFGGEREHSLSGLCWLDKSSKDYVPIPVDSPRVEVPLSCGIGLPSVSMSAGCNNAGPFNYNVATFITPACLKMRRAQ